ncbi:MAG: hypothetical protein IIV88_01025, partial [Erysipelotrichaceae bacterium]|nr:hypothetical protein [Erysipelotrichaceae bacterium]
KMFFDEIGHLQFPPDFIIEYRNAILFAAASCIQFLIMYSIALNLRGLISPCFFFPPSAFRHRKSPDPGIAAGSGH